MAKITFLGAAGTVTGSKYLVEAEGKRLLVDCGLFQGSNELEQRNWKQPPVDPAKIDWVVLTHAHIDHTGYVPRLVHLGYQRTFLCQRSDERTVPTPASRFGPPSGRGRAVHREKRLQPAQAAASALHRCGIASRAETVQRNSACAARSPSARNFP